MENSFRFTIYDPALIEAMADCKPGEKKQLTVSVDVTRHEQMKEKTGSDHPPEITSPEAMAVMEKKNTPKTIERLEISGTLDDIAYAGKRKGKASEGAAAVLSGKNNQYA